MVRWAARSPSLLELPAPFAPAVAVGSGTVLWLARHYPSTELVVLPAVLLYYGAWALFSSAVLAAGCAWLAQRGVPAGKPDPTLSLVIAGVYGLAPWSLLGAWEMLSSHVVRALPLGPTALQSLAHGPRALIFAPGAGRMASSFGTWGFGGSVAWGWAICSLALWRSLPSVDRGVRLRFGLLWGMALPIEIAFVCPVG